MAITASKEVLKTECEDFFRERAFPEMLTHSDSENTQEWMLRVSEYLDACNRDLFNSTRRHDSSYLHEGVFFVPKSATRIPKEVLLCLEEEKEDVLEIAAADSTVNFIPLHFPNLSVVNIAGCTRIQAFSDPVSRDKIRWVIKMGDLDKPHLKPGIWPEQCADMSHVTIVC